MKADYIGDVGIEMISCFVSSDELQKDVPVPMAPSANAVSSITEWSSPAPEPSVLRRFKLDDDPPSGEIERRVRLRAFFVFPNAFRTAATAGRTCGGARSSRWFFAVRAVSILSQ